MHFKSSTLSTPKGRLRTNHAFQIFHSINSKRLSQDKSRNPNLPHYQLQKVVSGRITHSKSFTPSTPKGHLRTNHTFKIFHTIISKRLSQDKSHIQNLPHYHLQKVVSGQITHSKFSTPYTPKGCLRTNHTFKIFHTINSKWLSQDKSHIQNLPHHQLQMVVSGQITHSKSSTPSTPNGCLRTNHTFKIFHTINSKRLSQDKSHIQNLLHHQFQKAVSGQIIHSKSSTPSTPKGRLRPNHTFKIFHTKYETERGPERSCRINTQGS